MQMQSTVKHNGQISLPIAARMQLGMKAGSRVRLEVSGAELVLTLMESAELPMSVYCGMLKGQDLGAIEPEKEKIGLLIR